MNAKGTRSITPLYGACIDGRLAAAQLLLEEGADWRVAREDGMTIYHAAAFEGKLDVVEYLLEQRLFDVSAKGALGYTALHDAAVEGRIEVRQGRQGAAAATVGWGEKRVSGSTDPAQCSMIMLVAYGSS